MFIGAAATFHCALAQSQVSEPRNVAQLTSTATVEVQQDLLTLTLASTRDGTDPAAVQAQLRQALDSSLALAKAAAQSGAMEVRTGQFSLQPRYGRDGKISGWTGTVELVLEGRDFGRIGATAGKVSAMVVSGVSFGLSREVRAKVEDDAQVLAIERFKAKAADIARGFGFAGYTLREVSVNSNDQGFMPRPRLAAMEFKAMAADAAVPLESGKSALMVTVSGSVQLK